MSDADETSKSSDECKSNKRIANRGGEIRDPPRFLIATTTRKLVERPFANRECNRLCSPTNASGIQSTARAYRRVVTCIGGSYNRPPRYVT